MQNSKKKINSLVNKAIAIIEIGTDPYFEGKHNFENYNESIEKLALERFKNNCKGCGYNEDEPIDFLKVTDSIIPEISNKMCGKCGGCTLSYKLRQSINKCELWEGK